MKFVKYFFIIVICCIFLGTASIFGMYKYVENELPDVATMKDIRLQTPMQIFSADGELIAQYGEKRRIPLPLADIPPLMIKAFIATEDSRFYEHHGIDPVGIFRAVTVMASSGRASQGASTITQQLARNFYLSPERTIMRKVKEVFLAVRIEQLFTKNEIMELYLNKIYLGNRAYGVGAAAYVYFGKTVNELTLSEMAMIAGLPKAPSTSNPLFSYEKAISRRNVVLGRMLEEKYITQAEYEQAKNERIEASYHAPKIDFSAPYLAEMARQTLYEQHGEDAYTDGYKVYTTVIRKDQLAATDAVRNNLIDYDVRHGYRGPADVLWTAGEPVWTTEKIIEKLKKSPVYGPLLPAVVLSSTDSEATVQLADGSTEKITLAGVRWARKFISDTQQGAMPSKVNAVMKAGEQVWIRKVKDIWWLGQVPEVNGAFVALNPNNGAIIALVGGFDFNMSEFNRVTQSLRQVGSNIKPFLYTAAMDKGLTLASLLNDVPISRWDAGAGSDWRPKNSPPRYAGPIRLRQGLGESKNVVMVRAMRAMGVDYAADYLTRFGFPAENINRTEALALGAPSFTPMQMVRGYAVMVNGGYLIDPYYIQKIENAEGEVLFEANPRIACPDCTDIPVIYGNTERTIALKGVDDESTEEITQSDDKPTEQEPTMEVTSAAPKEATPQDMYAPHVISTPLAFLIRDAMMTNIYGEPGWLGTGWRAARDLGGRRDIGGKTGTTNSSKDAWFSGYGPDVVASAWIGFDDNRRTLGRTAISGGEAGAKSAQPIWDDFMKSILEGVPVTMMKPPKGIIAVSIDSRTGKLGNSRKEYFIEGTEPKEHAIQEVGTTIFEEGGESQELF
ncbi:peptidoglycan glycosyltransferase/peptidoglycan DD-transpeptidase MrcA [Providencia stuartii]|uniref:peptidoglycan glycosyltransferase/peptidoglycan DD-transpeptidase MrcA n=1 Tax=Providencia stuartii TaxID=588 RepID=UPI00139ED405|nr:MULTISPECIES: peptidoglycan glycosyltransferase/peptidoglycan DD-transpeptidase MrcA [Providencia]EMD1717110.1 peptidoglycan glycosyltransferase/peptidoglycan DD-transpeptidase MrcA [Providencia stuartii]MBG5907651.1 peptidoglycan glycosyltransferase/peptidoglycan DD-transpeptidase MrcA [Providencia stuartii]MDT2042956.1 peptidoglycan glycosyltransferase/peptidoglycan DD-transpeptidase MrcA [Providencia stuartii]MTC11720.1 peptidoglycan glycosyltransferase/peptidoglycan DD-transpeptidase Mrc